MAVAGYINFPLKNRIGIQNHHLPLTRFRGYHVNADLKYNMHAFTTTKSMKGKKIYTLASAIPSNRDA